MTDKEIQQAVLRELEWEPVVQSTEIGVSVKDSIVTLSGFVDIYGKKYDAERAAKGVEQPYCRRNNRLQNCSARQSPLLG